MRERSFDRSGSVQEGNNNQTSEIFQLKKPNILLKFHRKGMYKRNQIESDPTQSDTDQTVTL